MYKKHEDKAMTLAKGDEFVGFDANEARGSVPGLHITHSSIPFCNDAVTYLHKAEGVSNGKPISLPEQNPDCDAQADQTDACAKTKIDLVRKPVKRLIHAKKRLKDNTKTTQIRHGFKMNEYVVYPAHGVGQIVGMEVQEIIGIQLDLFVIYFVKDKLTLRVPMSKAQTIGMRKLSTLEQARRSLEILSGRARIKRTMWSRRAQEYEAKINSGDINAVAEVVRDLYRSETQPEQSYSERQLYEAALDRMMREIAAVQKLSEVEAVKVIEVYLNKNQKRNPKNELAEFNDKTIEKAA